MRFYHSGTQWSAIRILLPMSSRVVIHLVCLEAVCFRSDDAKLIENFVCHPRFGNFVLLADEEKDSAEKRPLWRTIRVNASSCPWRGKESIFLMSYHFREFGQGVFHNCDVDGGG